MTDEPPPAPGTARTTALPSGHEAIEYELARMALFIKEGRTDPLVVETAREVAQLSAQVSRQLGREVTDENRDLVHLEGLHAWCRERFEYVRDPAGVELIQTPQRMLRGLQVAPEVLESYWKPIRKAMETTLSTKHRDAVVAAMVPSPKMVGDADEAVIITLALAAAIGIQPLRMRLGGNGDVLNYAWASAWAMGAWHDVDILHPEFDKHHEFDTYQGRDVPLD